MHSILNFFKREKEVSNLYIVSYPRSGHHAMIGFLNNITDFSNHYCEFYTCTRHNGEAIDCKQSKLSHRFKRHNCGAGNKYLKNHDFDLKLPFKSHHKYIVQYRHPFYSIESWYEMESGKGKKTGDWAAFFNEKLGFWQKFMHKWVVKHGVKDNVILVNYDELASRDKIISIAEFADCDLKGNIENFRPNFKKQTRILKRTSLQMTEKELEILPLLKKLGIKPIFN
ncbi:sulfotransferase domain-containing protein [Thalassotalea euphylliae]|uniref:Sulfotransferase domain-containing protein n=1 Tax=Thalassotalea euphylliae TaxID=1655234 RepID=A0A3E0U2D4_9GAMM|nr:sulfotransferase domain-containing protein [Thalassotalea euphylliae]REL30182.1 hypothetical protein DXX94_05400 [Thalassotalea euphylliae]